MSIEIRQMLIKSQVVQRAASDGASPRIAAAPMNKPCQPAPHEWRAECRRLIVEVLDERKER